MQFCQCVAPIYLTGVDVGFGFFTPLSSRDFGALVGVAAGTCIGVAVDVGDGVHVGVLVGVLVGVCVAARVDVGPTSMPAGTGVQVAVSTASGVAVGTCVATAAVAVAGDAVPWRFAPPIANPDSTSTISTRMATATPTPA